MKMMERTERTLHQKERNQSYPKHRYKKYPTRPTPLGALQSFVFSSVPQSMPPPKRYVVPSPHSDCAKCTRGYFYNTHPTFVRCSIWSNPMYSMAYPPLKLSVIWSDVVDSVRLMVNEFRYQTIILLKRIWVMLD